MEVGGSTGTTCPWGCELCRVYSPLKGRIDKFAKIYGEGVESGVKEVQEYLQRLKDSIRLLFSSKEAEPTENTSQDLIECDQLGMQEGEAEDGCTRVAHKTSDEGGPSTSVLNSDLPITCGDTNTECHVESSEDKGHASPRSVKSFKSSKDGCGDSFARRQSSEIWDVPDLTRLYRDDFLDINSPNNQDSSCSKALNIPKRLQAEEFGFIMKSASRHKKSSTVLTLLSLLSAENISSKSSETDTCISHPRSRTSVCKRPIGMNLNPLNIVESNSCGSFSPPSCKKLKRSTPQTCLSDKRLKHTPEKNAHTRLNPKKIVIQTCSPSLRRARQEFSKSHQIDVMSECKRTRIASNRNHTPLKTNTLQGVQNKPQTTGTVLKSLGKQWNLFTGKACTRNATMALPSFQKRELATQKTRERKLEFSKIVSKPPYFALKAPFSYLKTELSVMKMPPPVTKAKSEKELIENTPGATLKQVTLNSTSSFSTLKTEPVNETINSQKDIPKTTISITSNSTSSTDPPDADTTPNRTCDLPEPPSDYNSEDLLSSGDSQSKRRDSRTVKKVLKRMGEPQWTSTPEITKALERQKFIDPNEVFRGAKPPLEEVFKDGLRYIEHRARISSAWGFKDTMISANS